ncbi:hypothetical protein FFV08_06680 [Streptococcus sanguinis]|uniref:Uncharacterized protein n=1 Tax=Streptococcus sanguinis TaxID=1305 RepID=A0A7H8VAA6_STRSA|nr:hypothetical protein FFV08_06680 [Streptococcus sanguinis]
MLYIQKSCEFILGIKKDLIFTFLHANLFLTEKI